MVTATTPASGQPSQTASSPTSSQQVIDSIALVAYNFDAVTNPINYSQTDLLILASYAAQQFPKTGEADGSGFDWMNAFRSLLNPKVEKNA